ncbi:MAG: hypothetical protein R3B13_40340 [Polyangiaceae bacterium]
MASSSDANLQALVELLGNAETAILESNLDDASSAVAFAELVFQTAPFRAPKDLPAKWTDALGAWMRASHRPTSSASVMTTGSTYRKKR